MGKKAEKEAEANNGMQLYYNTTFLIFTLLCVNSLGFYSTWDTNTCLVNNPLLVPPAPAPATRRLLDNNQTDNT